MATYHGKDGLVKIGANTVAETTEWSLTQEIETTDDTVQGDSWKTHLVGMKSWSGSVNCFWDETDTNGQEALVVGASVTLNLYPEGATSGDTYYTGTATVTNVAIGAAKDSVVTRNFTFMGNGAVTEATVA